MNERRKHVRMNDAMREVAVAMRKNQRLNNTEIAQRLGVSASSVSRTLRAYDAVSKQDWNEAERIATKEGRSVEAAFRWAERSTGIFVPYSVYEAMRTAQKKQKDAATEAAEAPVISQTDDAKLDEIRDLLNNNMQALYNVMSEAVAVLRELLDVNKANADITHQRLEANLDCLRGIKTNTKRRGGKISN